MIIRGVTLLVLALVCGSCSRKNFEADLATRPYPFELHTTDTLPIQVFRDGTQLEIVNATERGWGASTIWVNQQFASEIVELRAGQRLTLDLFEFRNDLGEQFNAGGPLRTRQPTPVRLVELQPGEGQPLVGFISIRGGIDE